MGSLEADLKRAGALAKLDSLVRRIRDGQEVQLEDIKLVCEGLLECRRSKPWPATVNEFFHAWIILTNPDRVRDMAVWVRHELLRTGLPVWDPQACAVRERTADGASVGRCWFRVVGGLCPRHGDVRMVQKRYQETGQLTDERGLRGGSR